MPFEDISLLPELSSPPRFRIQEGYPELDIHKNTEGAGQDSFFLILDETITAKQHILNNCCQYLDIKCNKKSIGIQLILFVYF